MNSFDPLQAVEFLESMLRMLRECYPTDENLRVWILHAERMLKALRRDYERQEKTRSCHHLW